MIFDLKLMKKERKELIKIIKSQGISNEDVLNAILNTPREIFAGEPNMQYAYENCALPIGYGQTISQPYTVAFMTELLNVDKESSVLEIGTGCGYQSYILSLLAKEVYTIERIEELYNQTKELFQKLNISNIFMKLGDGSMGWDANSKFDRIIVTAACFTLPKPLVEQLNIGGIIVMPIGNKQSQTMFRFTKVDEDKYNTEQFDRFSFVPLIGQQAWEE